MKLTAKVADDQAFYVYDGPKINSVSELMESIESDAISDSSFSYHINNDNDFIKWIMDVYQHEQLGKSLKRVKTKKTFLKKLKEQMTANGKKSRV